MKIHEAIAEGTQRLESSGVSNARQDAERLLASELRKDRSYLLAHLQDPLRELSEARFLSNIDARASGKPLQYLLGSQEFRGLEFEVTPDVLIPRPETELLVEEALKRFSARKSLILDVGTGSGCIAVSLAVSLSQAQILATDLSDAALVVAERNATRLGVADRIQFLRGDLLLPLKPLGLEEKLDCIVSNPPYVAERHLPTLQREVRDWEPRIALSGGSTGLAVYEQLIPESLCYLRTGGFLIAEIGYNMQREVTNLFDSSWELEGIREDFSGIPRIVIARRR